MKLIKHTLIFAFWLLLVGIGFSKLLIYSNTPGQAAISTLNWPTNSHVVRDSELATLLIFGHPKCPCSKASVGELERLMPHIVGKIKAFVVFVKPKGVLNDWAMEDLWKYINRINSGLWLFIGQT